MIIRENLYKSALSAFQYILKCLLLSVSLLIINCAHQVYPSGGPVDTDPPQIIETEPLQNSLNVKVKKIHFSFSEYIDRRSFEESIFISPAGPKPPEFDWSGSDVDVILPYDLQPDKTYTITIGTDVVDVHNRNKMAESFTLAFSTGNKIDSGFINGKIFHDAPQGILITAYKIDGINPDTLNPAGKFPDYTTQSGKNGEFSLKYLTPGKYRVFALKDEYKNVMYDPGADLIGMWLNDIELSDSQRVVSGLKFQLTMFDTNSLKLYSAEAINNNHILLKFSKNFNLSSFGLKSFLLKDSISEKEIKVYDYSIDLSKPNSITLLTEPLDKKRFKINISGLTDSLGRILDPDYSGSVFTGSDEEDTIRPVILYASLNDSIQNIRTDNALSLKFNDFVKKDKIEKNIKLIDTNKTPVKSSFEWLYNTELRITPVDLHYNSWYKFIIDSIEKYNGSVSIKNPWVLNFKTFDKNNLSSIEGIVNSNENTVFLIEANHLDSKSKFIRRTKPNQRFKYENIPEGKYTFYLFSDKDSNGIYNYGNPYPFSPPEKFLYIQDTIKVRARWPVEGVKIVF